jgi:hypothetical protein
LLLSIRQTSFYLSATCGEHFWHLVAAPCMITKHCGELIYITTQSTTMVTILAHTCSCWLLQTQQVHRESTHFIPSTHSTIERGKISVPLSLTCPSIPCFTLTLGQGSNTLFQSCYSSCLMPFLFFTHNQSTSRKVLVYLEGMLPSGSFSSAKDGAFWEVKKMCQVTPPQEQGILKVSGPWLFLGWALIWQHPTPWVLPYSFSSHFLVPHPLTHITQPNLHGLMAEIASYKSGGSNYTTLLQSLPLTCEILFQRLDD